MFCLINTQAFQNIHNSFSFFVCYFWVQLYLFHYGFPINWLYVNLVLYDFDSVRLNLSPSLMDR